MNNSKQEKNKNNTVVSGLNVDAAQAMKTGDESMSNKRDLQFHSGRLSRGTPTSKDG